MLGKIVIALLVFGAGLLVLRWRDAGRRSGRAAPALPSRLVACPHCGAYVAEKRGCDCQDP